MSRPVLLTLGHGYSAAGARRKPRVRAGGGSARRVAGAGGVDARGRASSRWTGTTPRAVDAARSPRRATSWSRMPPDADGDPALARTAPRWRRADRTGSAICRRRASTATAAAAGSTRASEPAAGATRAAAGACGRRRLAWRQRPERRRSSGSRGSTDPDAAPSTGCAKGGRSASSRPDRCFSRIHVDDIAGDAARLDRAARPRNAVWNVADDEPAPPQDVIAYRGRSAAACRRRRDLLRVRRAVADGAQLLRRDQARLEPRACARAARRRAALSGLPRRTSRDSRRGRLTARPHSAGKLRAATFLRWRSRDEARLERRKSGGRTARQDDGRSAWRGRRGGAAATSC